MPDPMPATAAPFAALRRRKRGGEADPNQPFPGYFVLETLFERPGGGIYLADDERLDRSVVIHAFTPDTAAHPEATDRFFGEAAGVARLRHPGIVRALDVGRAGRQFFLVEESIRGESLQVKLDRLERGRVPEREMVALLGRAAEALQGLFENGLAHRALKPDKLLLQEGGKLKLRGVGFARELLFADAEAAVLSMAAYASPEQAGGACDADIRSDLYSLGCIGFRLLLGRPPFESPSPAEILALHRTEPPPQPRDLDPRVSSASASLLLALLAKDRDDRPRTPEEFLLRLRQHPLFPKEEAATPAAGADDPAAGPKETT